MSEPTPINPMITDSITQVIKYKEGMGSGNPSRITISFPGKFTYDDALGKFMNPSVPHLPTIEDCKVLVHYMASQIGHGKFLTVELRDDNTITLADIQHGFYIGAPRKDPYDVVLAKIEYES